MTDRELPLPAARNETTIEGDWTHDGRRRVLCRRCGWVATGRDEAKVRARALQHGEGCGLCEAHGKVCGEPYPMGGCTNALCVKVRNAEQVVAGAMHRAENRRRWAGTA